MKTFLTSILFVLLFAIFMTGCSDSGPGPEADYRSFLVYDPAFDGLDKIWPDDNLPKALVEYWKAWPEADAREQFSMEAPYFQKMVRFGHYRNYLNLTGTRGSLDHLEILALEMITDNKAVVRMYTHIEDQDGRTSIQGRWDLWVKAGNRWYHTMLDPLVFRDVS